MSAGHYPEKGKEHLVFLLGLTSDNAFIHEQTMFYRRRRSHRWTLATDVSRVVCIFFSSTMKVHTKFNSNC